MCYEKTINTKISTEAELVGADSELSQILLTNIFLESKRYMLKHFYLFKDNKTTILIQENSEKSSIKRTRHLSIFFSRGSIQKRKFNDQLFPN